jgi:SAM-dependent methyltransferase
VIETLPDAETCPVCGALHFISIYNDARDPITLDSFHVVKCTNCGAAYTNPQPASLDRYYPRQYRAYGPLVTRILSTCYGLRASHWARIKPGGASVLEVGCGSGLMLAAFRRRGWRVFGIERNEATAEAARQTLGHLVHYTPESLSHTLKRAGLTLSALSFTSFEHDPYGWVESAISRVTGRTNTLTRFLMGLDEFSPQVLFSFIIGVALLPPAMLLAGVSWAAGSGALMEAIAVDSGAAPNQL